MHYSNPAPARAAGSGSRAAGYTVILRGAQTKVPASIAGMVAASIVMMNRGDPKAAPGCFAGSPRAFRCQSLA